MRLEYAAIVQTLRNPVQMTFNFSVPAAQQWSNRTSPANNPIDDLLTWVRYVREESNREIFKIYMMTQPVWRELVQHPQTIARADVTSWRMITPEAVGRAARRASRNAAHRSRHLQCSGANGSGCQALLWRPGSADSDGERRRAGSDNSFGHMYFFGGGEDEPIVTLRYPGTGPRASPRLCSRPRSVSSSSRSRPARLLRSTS